MKNKGFYFLLFLFSILLFFNIEYGLTGPDCGRYYNYLSSLCLDHDLLIINQLGYQRGIDYFTITEYPPFYGFIGSLVLWIPFYYLSFLTELILKGMGVSLSFGYSEINYIWLHFSSWLFAIMTLMLAYRLCRNYFSKKNSLIAATAITFATNFYCYWKTLAISSHIPSAFSIILFIYIWYSINPKGRVLSWILLGLVGGVMTAIRNTSATFIILPFISILISFLKDDKKYALIYLRNISVFLAFLFIGFFPQLMVQKIIYGSFFYSGAFHALKEIEGFPSYTTFIRPKIFEVLFSDVRGLYIYSPILIFATIGFWSLIKKDRIKGILLLVSIAMQIYITSSLNVWLQGASFGNRYLISCLPIFMIAFAAFVENYDKRITYPIIGLCSIWSWLLYVYRTYGKGYVGYHTLFISQWKSFGKMLQRFQNDLLIVFFILLFFLCVIFITRLLRQKRHFNREDGSIFVGGIALLIFLCYFGYNKTLLLKFVPLKVVFILLSIVTLRYFYSLLVADKQLKSKPVIFSSVTYMIIIIGMFIFALPQGEINKQVYHLEGYYDCNWFKSNMNLYGYSGAFGGQAIYYLRKGKVPLAMSYFKASLYRHPGHECHQDFLKEVPENFRNELLKYLYKITQYPQEKHIVSLMKIPYRHYILANTFFEYGLFDKAGEEFLKYIELNSTDKFQPNLSINIHWKEIQEKLAYVIPENEEMWRKVSHPVVTSIFQRQDRMLRFLELVKRYPEEARRIDKIKDLRESAKSLKTFIYNILKFTSASTDLNLIRDDLIAAADMRLEAINDFLNSGDKERFANENKLADSYFLKGLILTYSLLERYPVWHSLKDEFYELMSKTEKKDILLSEDRSLLSNASFEEWEGGMPIAWKPDGSANTIYTHETDIVKEGAYSVKLSSTLNDTIQLYQVIPNHESLTGRYITFGSWVYSQEPNSARIYIYIEDGTENLLIYSRYHSGKSRWEFLTVTVPVTPKAYGVRPTYQMVVKGGETSAYFDGAAVFTHAEQSYDINAEKKEEKE